MMNHMYLRVPRSLHLTIRPQSRVINQKYSIISIPNEPVISEFELDDVFYVEVYFKDVVVRNSVSGDTELAQFNYIYQK